MLEIRHLTKVYPNGFKALDDLSLTVGSNEFVVVIGLSGSGKSTLLRCINRLIEPTSGQVLLDGVASVRASYYARGFWSDGWGGGLDTLPQAVALEMDIRDFGHVRQVFLLPGEAE